MFGFRVGMATDTTLGPGAHDALWDAWITFLDDRGLYCGGGGEPDRLEYVVASEAAQAIEGDREATRAWLACRPELRAWQVGKLEDLNQAV
jgi:uncharacterized protein YggL (DUF469 family)